MRYIKRLNLDSQDPVDSTWAVEIDGRIVTDSPAQMQLPKGSTNQRVEPYSNGQIRYNTDVHELEAYINGQWELLRTRRQGNIQFQTIATGNYVNTVYGPLSYRQDPTKPQNVLVFVENVYQVPSVNYTLTNDPVVQRSTIGVTNPGVTIINIDDKTDINVGQTVIGVTNPGVTIINIDDKTDINVGQTVGGDVGIAPGTTVLSVSTTTDAVTISAATLGTIQAGITLNFSFSTGTYVTFTSAPPEKPIYALNGFDGYFPPFI